ncbi:signal peptidase I SipW [Schinkia sp. CFF1]
MKKAKKFVSGLTTTVLFLVLIVMVVAVISSKASGGEPNLFGYQLKPVLSGSMEPTFMTGSIIAVKPVEDPTRLKKDDVITFRESKDKIVTHRIIEVVKSGENTMYRTKGDNNRTPDIDYVIPNNILGEYTGFTIPKIGYFVEFSQSKNGALLLVIPGIILLIYSAFSIFKGLKDIEKPKSSEEIEETI